MVRLVFMRNMRFGLPVLMLAVCMATDLSAAPALVVLVRHAEKETMPADDPNLTSTGRNRAQELARIVTALTASGGKVRGLYATHFKRTQQTLSALATQTGVSIDKVDDVGTLAKAILAKDGIVVVAGHSDSIPRLIQALGGPSGLTIDETDFGKLFLLTAPNSPKTALVMLRYSANGR
jgi:phosphohistidine phosphatase SixA